MRGDVRGRGVVAQMCGLNSTTHTAPMFDMA